MSLEIRVRGNKNFYLSLFYVLSFVSFLRAKKSKESTKENKENSHRFLRLHGVLRRSAVFSLFGFAESFLPRKLPMVKQCSAFQDIFTILASIKPPSKANAERLLAIYPPCNTIHIMLHGRSKGGLVSEIQACSF